MASPDIQFKVAEHSFSARFCWFNLPRAKKKTNLPSVERLFYLLNTRTICVIFLYNCMQCIDGFSVLLRRYVRKSNDAKNPVVNLHFLCPNSASVLSSCYSWYQFTWNCLQLEFSENHRLKAGVNVKAVFTSLNTAFLLLYRSRFKRRQIPMLITLSTIWQFCVNFWVIFRCFGKERFFLKG